MCVGGRLRPGDEGGIQMLPVDDVVTAQNQRHLHFIVILHGTVFYNYAQIKLGH